MICLESSHPWVTVRSNGSAATVSESRESAQESSSVSTEGSENYQKLEDGDLYDWYTTIEWRLQQQSDYQMSLHKPGILVNGTSRLGMRSMLVNVIIFDVAHPISISNDCN